MKRPTPPPGYAASVTASPKEPWAAVIAAALGLTLSLAFYELGVAQPQAYAIPDRTDFGILALGAGLLVGVLWARRAESPATLAPLALAMLSVLASASGFLLYWAFTKPHLDPIRLLLAASAGTLCASSAVLLLRAFGVGFARRGWLVELLDPLRAALIGGSCVAVLLSFPLLGVLRRAALLGALLAGFSVVLFEAHTRQRSPPREPSWQRFLLWLGPISALSALLGAEHRVPLEDVRGHAGTVVYALSTTRGHHVVSRVQEGLVLFSNDLLAMTSVDAQRFAEALVHPALALAEKRKTVLALDDGAFAIQKEALRWPDVARFRLALRDPELWELAVHSAWFRLDDRASSKDPRIVATAVEPSIVLTTTAERFDVVLGNFGDPSSYLEAKYYTVRFFEAVRQHLTPGGLFALQITSPFRTPGTHASIVSTLRAAGFSVVPYFAALPTLGEWGFALAIDARAASAAELLSRVRRAANLPAGTQYLTRETLPGLFVVPRDIPWAGGQPNRQFDQALVETYQREEHALSD